MISVVYRYSPLLLSVLLFLCACSFGQPTDDDSTGCVKDDECKGERICEDGVCVDPEDGDTDSAEAEEEVECSGQSCDALLDFCEYTQSESCEPPVGEASSMKECVERMMGYRDSGCFDGANLVTCLGGCASRAKSCQYVEMCAEDCLAKYCI